jgi:hypothetical protein
VTSRRGIAFALAIAIGLLLISCTTATTPSVPPVPATGISTESPRPIPPPEPTLGQITGLQLRTAKRRVHALKAGLTIKVVRRASSRPSGTVLMQSPAPGSLVVIGTVIRLVVAKPKPPPPQYPAVSGNPWDYNFSCCNFIYSPPPSLCDYISCIPSFWDGSGYVVQCVDGEFSKSGGRQGACSYHGGESRALLAP